MILAGTKESAFVIPRWLAYRDAVATGELAIPGAREICFASDFTKTFEAFRRAPSPLLASDLLGLAFLDDRLEAVELAKYLATGNDVRGPTARIVSRILGKAEVGVLSEKNLCETIRRLKQELRRFPRNAAKWVDLARCYTACGQNGSALRALRVAVGLAPYDRFCIRALCRFYIHTGDYEAGYEIFKKNPDLLKDPWLLAPAASIASIVTKPSPLPRRVNIENKSDIEAFHHSELFEAFGTEEYFHGKDRSARKALRAAWQKPSHSVITHAQWMTSNALPGLRGEVAVDFRQSAEAAAQDCASRGELRAAREYVGLWKQEEPYSNRPYILESFLHCLTEDFAAVKSVFEAAKQCGLVAGMLANNTVVAHACSGELEKAIILFKRLKACPGAVPDFTLLATEGLLQFARGERVAGDLLYKESEEKATTDRDKNLVFLNRILELHRFKLPVEARERRRFDELAGVAEDYYSKQLIQNIRKFDTGSIQPTTG